MIDLPQLESLMQGQDVVYANLLGHLEAMAENIVQAMNHTNVKRLIWISSMGIYGETGEDHGAILEPYRRSAQVVENSRLDYTIIRPAWFTDGHEIDYQLTRKHRNRLRGKKRHRNPVFSGSHATARKQQPRNRQFSEFARQLPKNRVDGEPNGYGGCGRG